MNVHKNIQSANDYQNIRFKSIIIPIVESYNIQIHNNSYKQCIVWIIFNSTHNFSWFSNWLHLFKIDSNLIQKLIQLLQSEWISSKNNSMFIFVLSGDVGTEFSSSPVKVVILLILLFFLRVFFFFLFRVSILFSCSLIISFIDNFNFYARFSSSYIRSLMFYLYIPLFIAWFITFLVLWDLFASTCAKVLIFCWK